MAINCFYIHYLDRVNHSEVSSVSSNLESDHQKNLDAGEAIVFIQWLLWR